MKVWIVSLFILFFFAAETSGVTTTNEVRVYATCYGKTPCGACKSCNYCKHCTAGGTCGVCKDLKKKPQPVKDTPTSQPAPTSGQCRAITKKGTRCSRSSRSGGYCWQHGG